MARIIPKVDLSFIVNGGERIIATELVRQLPESCLVLQPIMPLDLPVKVRSWELTVCPRSYIRRWLGVTRPAQARM